MKGTFQFDLIRNGLVVARQRILNTVTTLGKNAMLDTFFGARAKDTGFYLGLVDNAGWSAFAVADTMVSHAGWAEFTGYSEATRPQWTVGAASAGVITNPTGIVFTLTAVGSLKGLFVSTSNVKGGTAGLLWCGSPFGGAQATQIADIVRLTYSYNAG